MRASTVMKTFDSFGIAFVFLTVSMVLVLCLLVVSSAKVQQKQKVVFLGESTNTCTNLTQFREPINCFEGSRNVDSTAVQ